MVEAANTQVKLTDGDYKLVSEPVPQAGAGQVLIRVHYSTVNPYDKFLYSFK